MAACGLDRELRLGEEADHASGQFRGRAGVEFARVHEDRRRQFGERGAGGGRVVGACGAVGGGRLVIRLPFVGGHVGAGGVVPAAVEERHHGVVEGAPPGPGRLERRVRLGEPRLVLAQPGGGEAVLDGHRQTHRPGGGGDQRQAGDPLGVPGRVQRGQVAAGRVGEQVHTVQTQVDAECLHVVDLPVAPVRRRIGGDRGVARAAQVEQDQPPVGGEATQIAQVGGGTHRSAGQDDERVALAAQVVGEFGSVGCGEGRHGVDLQGRAVGAATEFTASPRVLTPARSGPAAPA